VLVAPGFAISATTTAISPATTATPTAFALLLGTGFGTWTLGPLSPLTTFGPFTALRPLSAIGTLRTLVTFATAA
jgi:hypothetical protein